MVDGSDKSIDETAAMSGDAAEAAASNDTPSDDLGVQQEDDPQQATPDQEPEAAQAPSSPLDETVHYEQPSVNDDSSESATPAESLVAAADDESADGQADDLSDDVEDEDDDEEVPVAPAGPLELIEDEEEDIQKDWYILKVQSNRERSIAASLQRKVSIEGLDDYFGEIMVPTEKVTEFKAGKKKIVERKIWPGYIAVNMHVNDDTWFAIRETSGIGDFTGSAGKPTPMTPQDVAKILHQEEEETDEAPKLAIPFVEGDKVKVKDGNFESFEGEVSKIDEVHGKVTVMLSIFGRPTPVELEYWQVEKL